MSTNIDRTFGHIDRATGDDAPQVEATYSLHSNFGVRQEWKFVMRMPRAIFDSLSSAAWNKARQKFEARAGRSWSPFEALILGGKLSNTPPHVVQDVANQTMARLLYKSFCEQQLARGNKAWVAPRTMTKARGPNGA